MKLEFSRQVFEIYLNLEFNKNASSGSRVVPSGRTDMTKLVVAFFAIFRTRLKAYRSRSGGVQASQQRKNRRNTASRSGDRDT